MKKVDKNFTKIKSWFGKSNIRKQLYTIYFMALFLPIAIIGVFLLVNTNRILTNYHKDLVESDNLRVKTILFEITTQVYNISEELIYDTAIREILTNNYYISFERESRASDISILHSYVTNHAEIDGIEIYTDNATFSDYKQFRKVNDEIANTDWYQKAISQSSVFYMPMASYDNYGNAYWNLCLIRKIPLGNTKYSGVLVIKVSDNYLRTRLISQEYGVMVTANEEEVFYSSDREMYGKKTVAPIDYEDGYYEYVGDMEIAEKKHLVEISTLHLYQSDSRLYIFTMNDQAYDNINNILALCILIILLAILIPGIIIHFFTDYFTTRVLTLRQAMNQVSNEDYELVNQVQGRDELSEAFSDLVVMVHNIKQKDADMYEARLNEQELISEQQIMEFKMLSSQVNPHFLYNTLETIRMKALAAGNKEIETAVKLLGRSMRYVLESTGTAFTLLQNEFQHVENYLLIQKLRFGDKFDHRIQVDSDIHPERLYVLPLLLQPIVENALLHGLEETEFGGILVIKVHKKQEGKEWVLMIDVMDNGIGMERAVLKKLRKDVAVKDMSRSRSIGMYNVNQRMKLTYGEKYGLRIYAKQGEGCVVRLRIPFERMNGMV
ncbi:histidine kinase [Lachnospiraceae bacterium OttesenSCG-928-D06]|nr:histidine kinase [Lachnospiraceae bacterium OttesenSCG-928-D06]